MHLYRELPGGYAWAGDLKTEFHHDRTKQGAADAFERMRQHAQKLIAERSEIAGRQLTEQEAVVGVHTGDRTQSWKPIPEPTPESSQFDSYIKDLEQQAEEEAFQKMTPTEQRLHRAKKAREQENEQVAREAAQAKRLEDPRVKPLLKKLDELENRIKFDPSREFGDLELVWQTREQLTTLGSSIDAGQEMFKEVLRREDQHRQGLIADIQSQRAELDAKLQKLSAEAPPPSPEAQPETEEFDFGFGEIVARIDKLKAEMAARRAEVMANEAEADLRATA